MAHLTGRNCPAAQSAIRYDFPARRICVGYRRVDEIWHTCWQGPPRPPKPAGPPASRPFLNRSNFGTSPAGRIGSLPSRTGHALMSELAGCQNQLLRPPSEIHQSVDRFMSVQLAEQYALDSCGSISQRGDGRGGLVISWVSRRAKPKAP